MQAGVIVGFDHDGPDIFDRLFDFFQESPLPDLSIGVLTAPAKTDLYGRLAREGRLIGEIWQTSAGSPFETNIRPAQMDRDTLLEGTRRLCIELYAPRHYEKRMLNLIDSYGESDAVPVSPSARDGGSGRRRALQMFRRIAVRGPRESEMVSNILRQASRKPAVLPTVMHFLARYEQARCVLDHFAVPAPAHAIYA